MAIVKHVNKSNGSDDEIYIGRQRLPKWKSGYFGNPIIKGLRCFMCGTAHEMPGDTLPCYERWLYDRLVDDEQFRNDVRELSGKTLLCWCDTERCHGVILARAADELKEEI